MEVSRPFLLKYITGLVYVIGLVMFWMLFEEHFVSSFSHSYQRTAQKSQLPATTLHNYNSK